VRNMLRRLRRIEAQLAPKRNAAAQRAVAVLRERRRAEERRQVALWTAEHRHVIAGLAPLSCGDAAVSPPNPGRRRREE